MLRRFLRQTVIFFLDRLFHKGRDRWLLRVAAGQGRKADMLGGAQQLGCILAVTAASSCSASETSEYTSTRDAVVSEGCRLRMRPICSKARRKSLASLCFGWACFADFFGGGICTPGAKMHLVWKSCGFSSAGLHATWPKTFSLA